MSIAVILISALLALAAAWLVNSVIGLLSGERQGGLLSGWWNIFSKMSSSPASYAEPLLDVLTQRRFSVGDRVRVLLISPDLERSMSAEMRELFRRCAGKIVRVEGVDAFGTLELHVLDDGSQSPDRFHHILFLEPRYAELVTEHLL